MLGIAQKSAETAVTATDQTIVHRGHSGIVSPRDSDNSAPYETQALQGMTRQAAKGNLQIGVGSEMATMKNSQIETHVAAQTPSTQFEAPYMMTPEQEANAEAKRLEDQKLAELRKVKQEAKEAER